MSGSPGICRRAQPIAHFRKAFQLNQDLGQYTNSKAVSFYPGFNLRPSMAFGAITLLQQSR